MPDRLREVSLKNPSQTYPWERRLTLRVSPLNLFWFVLFSPAAHLRPAPNHTAPGKPTGYTVACHGVARQGEDGRPKIVRQVRQVRQVRHKRHTTAARTPPLPSNRPALPCGNSLLPEPKQTAAQQTHGVYSGLPRRSPSGRRRAHQNCQTSQTSQTGQTQAPHHRNTHTAVAIK